LLFQYASNRLTELKEDMVTLEKLQVDLAEFFCEDPNSFHIEECFKSLAGFCSKFKQVLRQSGSPYCVWFK
jgi:hypothetical protein